MKKLFLYVPALILLAVSCEKEENLPAFEENDPFSKVEMITETVSGGRGDDTKATIGNSTPTFAWTDGDDVAVHISNGKYVYTSDEGAHGATITDVIHSENATFTVVYEAGYERDAFAVYPSTLVARDAGNYGQEGHTLDVTLPGSYTLAQVSGETSPCPMISTDVAGAGWDFYQLCGLMRLTVNSIPATAKRLEIDFNGKKVWGDFSIASPVVPGTSAIVAGDDDAYDVIKITKDGSNVVLGETSLMLNLPLPIPADDPLGKGYSKITVYAYDAISGGNLISFSNVDLPYSKSEIRAYKRTAALPDKSIFTFTFKDKDSKNPLSGLRFVRLLSCQNKLYNGTTTFGPYTVSSATGEADMDNPVEATLRFGANDGDQLAFQVIDANGKVYSGLYDVPAGCYAAGEYDLTVDVKAYTFTVASGKKVYFSPGDLGVDSGVYSFTEPFVNWASGNTTAANDAAHAPAKRTWFDFYFESGLRENATVNGVTKWRVPTRLNSNENSYEWNYIVDSRTMSSDVKGFYIVTIPGYQYCLLLPPDETKSTDIEADLTTGVVADYAKYLGKGFVLLFNTNAANYLSKWKWGGSTNQVSASQGYYWTWYNTSNRYYFTWTSSKPFCDFRSNRMRNHIRYVRDVE